MTTHKPSEPSPSDFKETAHASQEAGVADESAAYDQAMQQRDGEQADHGTPAEESSAHPS